MSPWTARAHLVGKERGGGRLGNGGGAKREEKGWREEPGGREEMWKGGMRSFLVPVNVGHNPPQLRAFGVNCLRNFSPLSTSSAANPT